MTEQVLERPQSIFVNLGKLDAFVDDHLSSDSSVGLLPKNRDARHIVVLIWEGNIAKHAELNVEEAKEFNIWRNAYNGAIWNIETQLEE